MSCTEPSRRRHILGIMLLLSALAALAHLQVNSFKSPLRSGESTSPLRDAIRNTPGQPRLRRTVFLPIVSPVIISEIGIGHPTGPIDADGNPSDWIELRNRSSRSISLKGYSLTDSTKAPRKWKFPEISIQSQESLLVRADGFSGVSSQLEFNYIYAAQTAKWKRRQDLESPTGWILRASRPLDPEPPDSTGFLVTFFVEVPEDGEYGVWLRAKSEGEALCMFEAAIDHMEQSATMILKPRPFYTTPRLRNPDTGEDFHYLKKGRHSLLVVLKRGGLRIERVILTRKNSRFGDGSQDVHAAFKLKNAGEMVALHSPEGITLDHVTFPALKPGQTYSRGRNGGSPFSISTPTPGGLAQTPMPSSSVGSSFVKLNQNIVLNAQSSDDIVRYTLNGSAPNASSPVYRDALSITNSTVLRARAYRPNAYPSAIITSVFSVGPPPKVPICWLVVDPDGITGVRRGLKRYPLSRGPAGERACYACILYPDGRIQETHVGLRLQGRSSRNTKAKKAFRIFCRSRYGTTVWPGRVFDGPGPARHGSLVVSGQSIVNNPIAMEVMNAVGIPSPRTRHVLLRINNDWYGIYCLMEDPNDTEYLRQTFGHLDLDVIKMKTFDQLKLGSMDEYMKTWGALTRLPRTDITTTHLEPIMSLDMFTRWVIGVQYLCIADNDQGYFVLNKQSARPAWSFINWDLDGAFYRPTFMSKRLGHPRGVRAHVFRGMGKDPSYQQFYLKEFLSLLNSTLAPERWVARIEEYEDIILSFMAIEFEGCREQRTRIVRDKSFGEFRDIYKAILDSRKEFFEKQPLAARKALQVTFGPTNRP